MQLPAVLITKYVDTLNLSLNYVTELFVNELSMIILYAIYTYYYILGRTIQFDMMKHFVILKT